MNMKHYDHTDTNNAMFAALVVLNQLILALPKCEEMAREEAQLVNLKLQMGNMHRNDLTDYLHQATIDYRSNTKQKPLMQSEGNVK